MENQTNNSQGFAIASLIIGILAFLLCFIPCINISAFIFGPAAIIFGVVALSKTNTAGSPKGMGIAGICLGGAAVFIAILMYSLIASNSDRLKNKFEDKFENYFEWAEEYENDFEEEFKDTEQLENLEKALDDLEGVVEEVNEEVNDVVKDVHNEVKEAIDEAKEDIQEAKEKQKKDIE